MEFLCENLELLVKNTYTTSHRSLLELDFLDGVIPNIFARNYPVSLSNESMISNMLLVGKLLNNFTTLRFSDSIDKEEDIWLLLELSEFEIGGDLVSVDFRSMNQELIDSFITKLDKLSLSNQLSLSFDTYDNLTHFQQKFNSLKALQNKSITLGVDNAIINDNFQDFLKTFEINYLGKNSSLSIYTLDIDEINFIHLLHKMKEFEFIKGSSLSFRFNRNYTDGTNILTDFAVISLGEYLRQMKLVDNLTIKMGIINVTAYGMKNFIEELKKISFPSGFRLKVSFNFLDKDSKLMLDNFNREMKDKYTLDYDLCDWMC